MSLDLVQYGEIHYYKNAIKDAKNIINLVEDSDDYLTDRSVLTKWKDWTSSNKDYIFGKQKQESPGDASSTPEELISCINSIKDAIRAASEDYAKIHNIDIGSLSSIAISKYFSGKSMGKHVDSGDDGPSNPVISVVAYLSDDHEGGEISFDEQGVVIKPEAGSIVIFPSRKPYFHASLPVISGIKYVALGFWYLNSSL